MAEIDYAFLADFAKVEAGGTLTSVGASWTFLQVMSFPASHRLSVAGRVRAPKADGPVDLAFSVTGPDRAFVMSTEGRLEAGPAARPYGERQWVGHLFALDLQIPIPAPGVYWIEIRLPKEGTSRRLAFEAVAAETQPAE